jgi:DNA-binding transcriptional MerR regulator
VGRVDDNELYPIGDVARRTGLSTSAIRFYADEGVIAPTVVTAAGYRLYDVEAIARLELVRTLRELDASLDEIRRLLADETTLRELATAHLALLEQQTRRLQARRAVMRTIVKQHTATEQVSLMHKLVSMSDDDRERLIDEFWHEVTDGLRSTFMAKMRERRPVLPEEPTTEQLEAWIELANLVQDKDFRHSVRKYFAGRAVMEEQKPEVLQRAEAMTEQQQRVFVEATAACEARVPTDSPTARNLADRFMASVLAVSGTPDTPELRLRFANASSDNSPAAQRGRQVATEFNEVLGRYLRLVETINGTAGDPVARRATLAWLQAAMRNSATSS